MSETKGLVAVVQTSADGQDTVIRQFFLYGEPPRPSQGNFAHIEHLDDRSRPANWVIRPHAHVDLHHVFNLESGGGVASVDGAVIRYKAPCVVVAPAGVVHGFRWREDSKGSVLTFSDAFLRSICSREPDISAIFAEGAWAAGCDDPRLMNAFACLQQELSWTGLGRDLAIEAYLSAILVSVLRVQQQVRSGAPPSADALLVARYRDFLEAHFREHPAIPKTSRALGVSPSRLRAACRAVADATPGSMLQDRLILEAQRLLHYSNMRIDQVARYLGFDDPAYFSRYFSRAVGRSPRAYKGSAREQASALRNPA